MRINLIIDCINRFQEMVRLRRRQIAPDYVQKNNSFTTPYVPIPFEVEKVNIGGAMNLDIEGIHGPATPRTISGTFLTKRKLQFRSTLSKCFVLKCAEINNK